MGAETRKIRVRQNWPGWIFLVTNCLRLSYYYHFKMIRPLKNANFRFSALWSTRSTNFRSHPEVKNSTIRKPLKSYTNRPKIIRLLPILHEQFKFFVAQHQRALVPCGLVCGRIRLHNRIPRTQISLSPNFQVNRTSTFWEIAISIRPLNITPTFAGHQVLLPPYLCHFKIAHLFTSNWISNSVQRI